METKVKLIGLAGKARSGKNLAAQYIRDILHKKNPSLLTGDIGFADGVKYVAAEALSVNRMTFFEDENKKELFRVGETIKLTGREILQRIGTEMFRDVFTKDFWVYRLMKIIKAHPNIFFIITDVRFLEEVKFIEAFEGIVVKLHRETELVDYHPSETSLSDYNFKYNIYNDGSKEKLKKDLEVMIKYLNI